MWPHFHNLLSQSYHLALQEGSSTGVSVFWLGLGVLVLGFALTVLIEWFTGGQNKLALETALKSWKSSVAAILALSICWLGLFGWSVVKTVYTDHQNLVATLTEARVPPVTQEPPRPLVVVKNVVSPSHGPTAKLNIRQKGNGNTANPGVNAAPVQMGDCGVFQNGGSNNVAAPNCVPPQRTLSAEQHDKFVDALRQSCPFKVAVRAVLGNEESMKYAQEIGQGLKDAGCSPQRPKFMWDAAPSYGVELAVHDSTNIPPGAEALRKAFADAQITVSGTPFDQLEEGVVYVMVGLREPKRK